METQHAFGLIDPRGAFVLEAVTRHHYLRGLLRMIWMSASSAGHGFESPSSQLTNCGAALSQVSSWSAVLASRTSPVISLNHAQYSSTVLKSKETGIHGASVRALKAITYVCVCAELKNIYTAPDS